MWVRDITYLANLCKLDAAMTQKHYRRFTRSHSLHRFKLFRFAMPQLGHAKQTFNLLHWGVCWENHRWCPASHLWGQSGSFLSHRGSPSYYPIYFSIVNHPAIGCTPILTKPPYSLHKISILKPGPPGPGLLRTFRSLRSFPASSSRPGQLQAWPSGTRWFSCSPSLPRRNACCTPWMGRGQSL